MACHLIPPSTRGESSQSFPAPHAPQKVTFHCKRRVTDLMMLARPRLLLALFASWTPVRGASNYTYKICVVVESVASPCFGMTLPRQRRFAATRS